MANSLPKDSDLSSTGDVVFPAMMQSLNVVEKQEKGTDTPRMTQGRKRVSAIFLILANSILVGSSRSTHCESTKLLTEAYR